VDACAALSRAVSRSLESDPDLAETYALEVGSPGLTRPLKRPSDFDRFAGRLAVLRLTSAMEGCRRLRGRLLGYDSQRDLIRLADEARDKTWEIPLADVAKARLDFDFPAQSHTENA
jgi:ribosome maturation factor RimP